MKLLIHSWRQIFGNFSAALKISWPLALPFVLIWLIGGGMPVAQTDMSSGEAGAATLVLLVMLIAYMLVTVYVAISWHRFVLRGTATSAQNLNSVPLWSYLGRSLQIGLIVILPLFVLVVILSTVGVGLGSTQGGSFVISVVFSAIFSTIVVRLSLILPGLCVDKPMLIGESWKITAPMMGDILAAMFVLSILQTLPVILVLHIIPSATLYSLLGFVQYWLVTMLALSVLTTLYGHLVEGRELNA